MLAQLVVWYLVFLFSVTFHEYAHALVARWGGDPTAYQGGLLTMEPTVHIRRSPFGLAIVPILSFLQWQFMIGWASVPFDPSWGKRHPRTQALMSLAGPVANLVLMLLAFLVLKLMLLNGVVVPGGSEEFGGLVRLAAQADARSPWGALVLALSVAVELNLLLFCANLLPVPPLDGAGVLEGLFPSRVGPLYDKLRDSLLLEMLVLVVFWQFLERLMWPLQALTLNLLS